ncbi:hypothetical protein EIN_095590 [Entamoeba invadens IP1]|uniref:Uncharacterized protein n=1 Tax=Entamoeba invadens IP1 TaxID=370355 RepID=A0A0A1U092_ENTIV|nr:hypothetical protein EIN_095590 [Entamoeba invadens IP1]ELP87302.1 hypothetical protein EIN_095590 [Entamoeba invadens IP1]|eukprot:XP_004254073.1 hypothetical protein EIN_095590 [Entamoeba invadens IP1]
MPRRKYVKTEKDYIDDKPEVEPMPMSKKITWFVFAVSVVPILFFVPTLLSNIAPFVSEHIEWFYGLWVIYGIIFLVMKLFYLKNHNWDSFLSMLCIAAIIGMGLYRFLNFDKHFENKYKRIGFYLWLAVCAVLAIVFFLIDTTDYYKVLEHEQQMQEADQKRAEKIHQKYVQRREKDPPFWMKTKTRKTICDTIVIAIFIVLVIGVAVFFVRKYNQFQYRVKRGLDVNEYGDYYGYEGYTGDEFNPQDFIKDDDLKDDNFDQQEEHQEGQFKDEI